MRHLRLDGAARRLAPAAARRIALVGNHRGLPPQGIRTPRARGASEAVEGAAEHLGAVLGANPQ
eukprot:6138323-Lingulodinium_polyedra.AAC.1